MPDLYERLMDVPNPSLEEIEAMPFVRLLEARIALISQGQRVDMTYAQAAGSATIVLEGARKAVRYAEKLIMGELAHSAVRYERRENGQVRVSRNITPLDERGFSDAYLLFRTFFPTQLENAMYADVTIPLTLNRERRLVNNVPTYQRIELTPKESAERISADSPDEFPGFDDYGPWPFEIEGDEDPIEMMNF